MIPIDIALWSANGFVTRGGRNPTRAGTPETPALLLLAAGPGAQMASIVEGGFLVTL